MQTTIPRRAAGRFRRALAFALTCGCMHVSGSTGFDTTDQAIALALDTARGHASETQTPANRNAAIRAYREAAKLGSTEAKLELARMLLLLVYDPPDDVDPQWPSEVFPEALELYREAAREGDAAVKYEFAVAFDTRGGSSRLEYLDRLREAAELGHGRAQFDYAVKLLEGIDLARDDAAAASWLGRSAEQGYREPRYLLATLRERGRGVPKDAEIAMRLYRLAAQQGQPMAGAVLRTPALLDGAPCRLDEAAPSAWRPVASRMAMLQVPPDASEPTVGNDDIGPLRITAPGITIMLARADDELDEKETIVLGGDALAVQFTGDATEGTVTLRWPMYWIDGNVVRLDVAYAEPATRDIACRIAGSARLLDPVSDLELVRIDAGASPPRALLRGERSERWAVVGDSVTRDHGRVTTIKPGYVEVTEVIALQSGSMWRERIVTMRPISSSVLPE